MQLNTSKKAVIVSAITTSLTGQFAFRSVAALAQEAGASESEVHNIASELGLVKKRRRADGAVLYGISGRVNNNDVTHTPVTTWNRGSTAAQAPAAPSAADVAFEQAKIKVRDALNDNRWRSRSLTQLARIANIDSSMLARVLTALGARTDGAYASIRR